MAVFSLGLGWLIAGRFVRPLRSIITTARDISASNLHRRLGLRGRGDEFTELGETLDDLFTRLEASFDSQRHFIANASPPPRRPRHGSDLPLTPARPIATQAGTRRHLPVTVRRRPVLARNDNLHLSFKP
jgi:HAMP domain-containing protein